MESAKEAAAEAGESAKESFEEGGAGEAMEELGEKSQEACRSIVSSRHRGL
jgi:hypothetical protein